MKNQHVQIAIYHLALYLRYIAVHNPLNYKQAMNDDDAIRKVLTCALIEPQTS